MNTADKPRIESIVANDQNVTATLTDGRTISVPRWWSWRLAEATPQQRVNFEIIGNSEGARWPDLDEDISAQGMLTGSPARRPEVPA